MTHWLDDADEIYQEIIQLAERAHTLPTDKRQLLDDLIGEATGTMQIAECHALSSRDVCTILAGIRQDILQICG